MSDTRYPTRMHEVLGVERDEEFGFEGLSETFVVVYGDVLQKISDTRYESVNGPLVCEIINHPERITRRPRLTGEQVRQLRALVTLGFKWLAKQPKGCVMFFYKKPHKNAIKNAIWFSDTGDEPEDYGVVLPNDTHLSSLVSWSDPEPLDIVATLKANGVEVEE